MVAYFCTPDLTILHAVSGPESAPQFLQQAKWAVELAGKLRDAPAAERSAIARKAHEDNTYWRSWVRIVQSLRLKDKILQPLNRANAEELFLELVNQRASDDPVRIVGNCDLFGPPIPSLRPRS